MVGVGGPFASISCCDRRCRGWRAGACPAKAGPSNSVRDLKTVFVTVWCRTPSIPSWLRAVVRLASHARVGVNLDIATSGAPEPTPDPCRHCEDQRRLRSRHRSICAVRQISRRQNRNVNRTNQTTALPYRASNYPLCTFFAFLPSSAYQIIILISGPSCNRYE